MKKIAILLDSISNSGGTERVVSNLANEWIKHNEVTIISLNGEIPFYELDKRIKIINFSNKKNFNSRKKKSLKKIVQIVSTIIKLRKIIKKERFEFLYTAYMTPTLIGYFANFKFITKHLAAEHISYELGTSRLNKVLKKNIYPKIDKIIVLSNRDRNIYKKMGCDVITIPNALSFVCHETPNYESNTIISVGRLCYQKGYEELIPKLKEFFKKNKKWKLKIYGDGENKKILLDLIERNNLKNNIEIFDSVKNIKEKYLESSIYLMCSRYEGFPMVLLEAMECGLPCISFDCPTGPREIIKNEEDGFLVNERDFDMFVKKIEILTSNKNLRKKMGEKAKLSIKRYQMDEINKIWVKKIFSNNIL